MDKERRKEGKMAEGKSDYIFWQFNHNFNLGQLIVWKELILEHWRGEWCPVNLTADR